MMTSRPSPRTLLSAYPTARRPLPSLAHTVLFSALLVSRASILPLLRAQIIGVRAGEVSDWGTGTRRADLQDSASRGGCGNKGLKTACGGCAAGGNGTQSCKRHARTKRTTNTQTNFPFTHFDEHLLPTNDDDTFSQLLTYTPSFLPDC
jgi:hypothetical protein